MSFFQVRNYADEFRQAVEGKITPPPIIHDETVAPVDLEETGQDQIAKLISAKFKGHGLARGNDSGFKSLAISFQFSGIAPSPPIQSR